MTRLTLQQDTALKEFGLCFIELPIVSETFEDFDDLRFNRDYQSDPQCMMLTGETGSGKTRLIQEYRRRVNANSSFRHSDVPVLITNISSNKGLENTLVQILSDLDTFGCHQKKRGMKTDLTKKVVRNLTAANVELLIINEFHDLIKFKSYQEIQIITSALKFISEEANIPIVLVGMPWMKDIINDSEWGSRLRRRKHLEYFSYIRKEDREHFRLLLVGFSKRMSFDTRPVLHSKELTRALFAVCRGEFRQLMVFLYEACKMALLNEEPTISRKILAETFEKLGCEHLSSNPFTIKFKEIPIPVLSIPSRYNPNALEEKDEIIDRVFEYIY
ncbi:TniB family NTP-binding protein [Shewanella kaireitica]|uniref:TniB family NTP-binding protein n=1 Tax=Shewanella kaireitica TaxID=212021 RepID=UPI002010624F|nr:TniB family NTP-binding protein [Shewanella kaireitica]MCL1092801.1 TniB family NTP-binding protein [Shewanella kaireitica]